MTQELRKLINFRVFFKNILRFLIQYLLFSTRENVGYNFETHKHGFHGFHRNGQKRQIGRLGGTFLIGRLRVKMFNTSFLNIFYV